MEFNYGYAIVFACSCVSVYCFGASFELDYGNLMGINKYGIYISYWPIAMSMVEIIHFNVKLGQITT